MMVKCYLQIPEGSELSTEAPHLGPPHHEAPLSERPPMEECLQVIKKGLLSCKISVLEGKKCSDRTWKPVFAVLRQNELYLTRDRESHSAHGHIDDQHIPLKSCMVEIAHDYAKKKKNVFRLTSHTECEYLFQTEDKGTMLIWIQAVKSINEPDKAEKMDALIACEQLLPHRVSPQLGSFKNRAHKLSGLNIAKKLATSPSMRRKKSNADDKGKEEGGIKKSWSRRIPGISKSAKKTPEEVKAEAMAREAQVNDNMQFGACLEDCFPSPHDEYVPLMVKLCTCIIEARGLEIVGVYRVPGNSAAVNTLTEEFNRGIDNVNIDNEKLLDINVISSLLKSFFRKLPEPLVPSDMYDDFIASSRNPTEDKRKLKLKRLLHLMPPHANATFRHMAEHLNKVASYGHINKMDAKNLAIMFGPTLVRKKGDDTVSLVTDMSDQCRIVESIILHHEWFFSEWDQDNYIPMETSVETVKLEKEDQDSEEEADSAISTKELISSIVHAASHKQRRMRRDKEEGVTPGSSQATSPALSHSSPYNERNIDEAVYLANLRKSISSMTSSEEFPPGKLGALQGPPAADSLHTCEDGLSDLEFADASSHHGSHHGSHPGSHHASSHSPSCTPSSSMMRGLSDMGEGEEGGTTGPMSQDAIHSTLKRIGNDVSVLLHTFEQKQMQERERRRREAERIEVEHQRTAMELEAEDHHSVEDWLSHRGQGHVGGVPDLVSSSYVGGEYPYDATHHRAPGSPLTVAPSLMVTAHDASQVTSRPPTHDRKCLTSHQSASSLRQQNAAARAAFLGVGGPHRAAPRHAPHPLARRHASLDSLIDLLDRGTDHRSSWASSDSEDGSDLLTSITATFDQKLQILLNPKYKLTGGARRGGHPGVTREVNLTPRTQSPRPTSPRAEVKVDADVTDVTDTNKLTEMSDRTHLPSLHALVDPSLFRDPSLHRSPTCKSDPKMGVSSRFDRVMTDHVTRAASSSPVTVSQGNSPRRAPLPDFRTFLGNRNASPSRSCESPTILLTRPRKLEEALKVGGQGQVRSRSISKSEKTEMNATLARLSRGEDAMAAILASSKVEDDKREKENVKETRGERVGEVERERVGEVVRNSELFRARFAERRHTVGGDDDADDRGMAALSCDSLDGGHGLGKGHGSAWSQLQPSGSMGDIQGWIQQERGRSPDLEVTEG